MTHTEQVGLWGEKHAEKHLKRKKYRILGRRVRVGQRDEIDLVAKQGKTLVFVEVKTRKSEVFGRPAAAVNRDKRRLMSRAAVRYLRERNFPKIHFRFDVVEVIGELEDKKPQIRVIENAFTLDKRYQLPY
jgi:putative endonuclease